MKIKNGSKSRRIARTLTPRQKARLQRQRRLIARELPDLIAQERKLKEASDEPTLSGELRRAVHSSSLSLADIAVKAGIPPLALNEFLTGERTLRSDVLDRLTQCLELELSPRH